MSVHAILAIAVSLAGAASAGSDGRNSDRVAKPIAAAVAASPAAPVSVADDTNRYCVETKTTGSMITRRTCRSRSEWIAKEGVDPIDYVAK